MIMNPEAHVADLRIKAVLEAEILWNFAAHQDRTDALLGLVSEEGDPLGSLRARFRDAQASKELAARVAIQVHKQVVVPTHGRRRSSRIQSKIHSILMDAGAPIRIDLKMALLGQQPACQVKVLDVDNILVAIAVKRDVGVGDCHAAAHLQRLDLLHQSMQGLLDLLHVVVQRGLCGGCWRRQALDLDEEGVRLRWQRCLLHVPGKGKLVVAMRWWLCLISIQRRELDGWEHSAILFLGRIPVRGVLVDTPGSAIPSGGHIPIRPRFRVWPRSHSQELLLHITKFAVAHRKVQLGALQVLQAVPEHYVVVASVGLLLCQSYRDVLRIQHLRAIQSSFVASPDILHRPGRITRVVLGILETQRYSTFVSASAGNHLWLALLILPLLHLLRQLLLEKFLDGCDLRIGTDLALVRHDHPCLLRAQQGSRRQLLAFAPLHPAALLFQECCRVFWSWACLRSHVHGARGAEN
mmetsp:Transcript_98313/g.233993  ORF Transcript_98313/g.233993 Transcript_98313/m.233993 type:complete len:467 (+) Transcript_98313:586-1986(+)